MEALSLMTKQLVSSITTLNYSMDHSFTEMKETLGNLAYVEESANEEGSVNSDAEKETDKAPNKDSASTKDQNLSGSSTANNVNNQLTLTNRAPEISQVCVEGQPLSICVSTKWVKLCTPYVYQAAQTCV